ncbi:MAG: phasin family protein [Paracoccaceae bacterium]
MTQQNQFPFIFDAEKMKEMFKFPEMDKMFDGAKMPGVDIEMMMQAQQKNVQALIEANQAAMAGYQELYKRQVALVEESMAKAKDQLAEMQHQPMSPEHSAKAMESLKTSVDKAVSDVRELAEIAQRANTEAFNIIKSRFEEALAEFKSAVDKSAG